MDMANTTRRQVVKSRIEQSGKEDDSSIDRLSNLPEAVIHHILSLLDTSSAVQTSVLSRRWRCAWKHLSVLAFHGNSSPTFERYVEKVLSLRYELNLSKVIFSDYIVNLNTQPENSLFARVSRYALSHGTQHLGISLLDCSVSPPRYMADSLGFESDNCSRLKSLELECFSFGNRFRWSDFLALEKLDLSWCTFFAGEEEDIIDPFSNLPCLKHLVLSSFHIGDNADTRFRISGLQLLSLRLTPNEFHKMEIHAPKLEYFYLDYINHLVEFTKLTLPSLEHARILVDSLDDDVYEEGDGNGYIKKHMIPLFHGLNNATSLALCSLTVDILGGISDYLEDRPSPFTRLKSLTVGSLRNGEDVPFAVLNYFLKGSADMKPVVKVEQSSGATRSSHPFVPRHQISCPDLGTIPTMEKQLETPLRSRSSSRNIRNHLSSDLHKRSQCQSADLLGLDYDNCSLKSLELGGFSFDNGFQWSSFVLLGRLELFWCTFDGEGEVVIDPFADLPCLKHLVLDTLFNIFDDDDVTFCIFGVHLLSLRVSCSEFRKFEVYAPKLESLSLVCSEHLLEFTELTLPSLGHADIRVDDMDVEDEIEYIKEHMIPLFDGLKNATSLVLCSQTARMLRLISGYLEDEDQCSPFTRLKSLIVASPRSSDDLPEAVLNYLKGLLI
ncbi:FBD-associated F-box protein At1g66310 [Linum grandiflorum]